MQEPVIITIAHRLGRAEAMRRIKSGLAGATANFPVLKVEKEIWQGDRLTFRMQALGQAASGHIDVAEDHVTLDITLPWLLQKFAAIAQKTIQQRGTSLLEKK
jgi:hypothetical protein